MGKKLRRKSSEMSGDSRIHPEDEEEYDEGMAQGLEPVDETKAEEKWADHRNKLKENFVDDILDQFYDTPEVEKPPPPPKNRPLYKLRRKIGCGCAHVPLNLAVIEGSEAEVKRTLRRLTKKDPDKVNEYDFKGRTALSLAVKEKREDLADLILGNRHCDVDKPDRATGLAPLHHCVQLNLLATIQKLSWRECEVDPADKKGMTPLMLACALQNYNAVEMLIFMMADTEAVDENGWRPIHYACDGGSLEVVELLAEQSVDLQAKDHRGRDPSFVAQHRGFGEVVALLENWRPPHGSLI
uniref:Uncharacterized protein n=1 Tax=Heterosigma akashiwo TaxID=2829 RepID=A0A6V2QUB7_HETAK|mmetsp:Transcript_7583/g.13440  ORF Transcript_7583/g.13440 Transcript_7583/m.13440 type:complete len:298 (-) Transcript_7583:134-1027(-)